ncbi:MAG TPA: hypothetical protein VGK88_09510 [bacterium]|jgi:hypothetical protein
MRVLAAAAIAVALLAPAGSAQTNPNPSAFGVVVGWAENFYTSAVAFSPTLILTYSESLEGGVAYSAQFGGKTYPTIIRCMSDFEGIDGSLVVFQTQSPLPARLPTSARPLTEGEPLLIVGWTDGGNTMTQLRGFYTFAVRRFHLVRQLSSPLLPGMIGATVLDRRQTVVAVVADRNVLGDAVIVPLVGNNCGIP